MQNFDNYYLIINIAIFLIDSLTKQSIIMNRILLILSMIILGFVVGSAQTTIEGKVTDANTGETIISGVVKIFKNGVLVSSAETDIDGNYFASNVQPGTYDIEVEYVGYATQRQTNIIIKAGKTNRVDFKISNDENILKEVQIIDYVVPLIEIDNTTQGSTVTQEKIRSLPTKQINAIAATSAGISSRDGGEISIRGSRANETVYYLDGVRVSGNLIPQSEIEQLQVVTGGIEALYGDVSGGVISLTSRGPSSKYMGSIEAEKSLDGYGYNLFSANVAGPILKRKDKSIIGFRFSGQYRNVKDNNPSATGVWRAPSEVIDRLEAAPIYNIGGTNFPSLELLRTSDLGKPFHTRPNDDVRDIDVTGRLDFRLSEAIDVQVSGNFNDRKDRFTPSAAWSLLNWRNNPYEKSNTYRGNLRFTHKLGRQSIKEVNEGKTPTSGIKNLFYSLTLGYQKSNSSREDLRHKDTLFNYGYYGITQRTWEPIFDFLDFEDPRFAIDPFQHVGYREVIGEYTLNPYINPILGSYNSIDGVNINGILNDNVNTGWSNLYSNVGQVYNNYTKNDNDQYTLNLATGFDFFPGSSDKGRHSIQLGFIYEQSTNRFYDINPTILWQLANGLANQHIRGLDTTMVIDTMTVNGPFGPQVENVYRTLISPDQDDRFYRSIRELKSTDNNVITDYDFVNVWDVLPSQLRLDMFSAAELVNRPNLISYAGFDHLGNKLASDVKFEDFFTLKNANGNRSFVVAPQSPIYGAAYIQDKFSYKDIIFRLGMRVDYFDANTKVPRDPYALYEIESAKDYYNRLNLQKPASIGDDYNVYVESDESEAIKAFRKGDQWYLPNGTAVSGNSIYQGELVYPSYVGKNQNRVLNIQNPDFDVNTAFVDYKPKLNFMPRLAFSFPISEDAGFFAHYDVLYQRPPSNSYSSPLDYYFFEDISRTNPDGAAFDNPNLKPVRTVDYEVGFQKKVSPTAAIKISAYYKEIKDLIQQRVFTNVATPLNQYKMFDNLDFGTVKGFSIALDRRRTNNLELNATYTLQFADGSGSDANSSNGINSRGPIRNLIPLSYDERHRITTVIDYKFPSGSAYQGVKIGKFGVFENLQITLTNFLVSGQPYTRGAQPSQFGASGYAGSINGARLPWNFISDLNLTKRIPVTINKESSKKININAYCRVQNLFNTRNIVGVYRYSNDAYNDGYLQSSFGQAILTNIERSNRDLDAYLDAYSWRLNSPGNFNLPRRLYVGAIMDF